MLTEGLWSSGVTWQALDGDDKLPLPQAVCGTFSCAGLDEGMPHASNDARGLAAEGSCMADCFADC